MNIIWFRNDLRVRDNPALHAAMQNGSTIAVYCIAQDQWLKHNMAAVKQDFILRHIKTLQQELNALNIPLIILDVGMFSNIPSQLKKLIETYQVTNVFFNHEYEWNEHQLTQLVNAKLSSLNVNVMGFHDQCLIPPGSILNKQGGFYKVFTAFKNEYLSQLSQKSRPVYAKPIKQDKLDIENQTELLDEIKLKALENTSDNQRKHWESLWVAGEEYALNTMDAFVDERIYSYHEQRDIPSIDGTSKLSAYLAIGAISTRQCFQMAVMNSKGMDNKGVHTWVVELIWRDFYRHLIYAFPEVCRYKPFKQSTDQLPWKQQGSLFKAWCEGRTGYPIVDAAMNQLVQTGWMHNRLRMVTAMFLTKHLFVDWRLGEQFFMEHLVDGDFASNNGGWQWSASTGVDAVPYFRIFNPTRQSQRFDTKGDFIRTYLPELSSLDSKSIHQPSKEQIIQCGYVMPIVDHTHAVAKTKSYFKQLSDASISQNIFQEYGLS